MGCSQSPSTYVEYNNKSKKGIFLKRYEDLSILGSGKYGRIKLCRSVLAKDQKFAVKQLRKEGLKAEFLENILKEVDLLITLDHPNIVKYLETIQEDNIVYVVMEYISGDSLSKIVSQRRFFKFKEKDAGVITNSIAKALSFIHAKDLLHRDLRPSKILFSKLGDYKSLRLIDFGFTRHVSSEKEAINEDALFFAAPETFNDEIYDTASDLWALGILLYNMLTGVLPFTGKNYDEIEHSVCKEAFDEKILKKSKCSEEAIDLVKKLLKKDSEERINLPNLFEHEWIHKYEKLDNPLEDVFNEKLINSLKTFSKHNILQKEVFYYLAKISEDEEVSRLKQAFTKFDKDFNGSIDKNEIIQCFELLKLNLSNAFS